MRNERIGNRIQKLEDEIERRADTEEGKREIARVSANGSSNISAAMAKHDRRCAADAAYRARTDTLRQEWLAAAVNSAQATETKEKVDSEIKAFTADHESRENALEEAREKAMEELDLLPDNFANEYCDRKKALEKDWSDYCNISRQKYMDAVAESSAAAQVLEIAIKAFQVETGGAALSYMLRVANMEEDTIRRVAALEAKTVANGYNSAEAATAAIMAANIWRKYAI